MDLTDHDNPDDPEELSSNDSEYGPSLDLHESLKRKRKEEKFEEDEIPCVKCTFCDKSCAGIPGLIKHLECNKGRNCKELYGNKYDELISASSNKSHQQLREEKLKRRSEYYKLNREHRLRKQREYYHRTRGGAADYYNNFLDETTTHNGINSFQSEYHIQEPSRPSGIINIELDPDTDDLPFPPCIENKCKSVPGESKINHQTVQEEDLLTLPDGVELTGKFVDIEELNSVDSFLGMSLSGDDESVEIKYLINKSNITMNSLLELFHGVLSVLEMDMKDLVSQPCSPIILSPQERLDLHRNRITKEIIANNNVIPELNKPQCIPVKTAESQFISESMTDKIPNSQILVNSNLYPIDFGAIGVAIRENQDSKDVLIKPLFTVNMMMDSRDNNKLWQNHLKKLFIILVNWLGSKSLLNDILHLFPCTVTAKDIYFHELGIECYNVLQEPKESVTCDICGLKFEYNKFLFKEKTRYLHHIDSHRLNCKVCGFKSGNLIERKYHERLHKEDHIKCIIENCNFVSRSSKALENHLKVNHSSFICNICSKEFPKQSNLDLHMQQIHNLEISRPYNCPNCPKIYKSEALMVTHLNDSHSIIKYKCSKHPSCDKFFVSQEALEKHLNHREHQTETVDLSQIVTKEDIEAEEAFNIRRLNNVFKPSTSHYQQQPSPLSTAVHAAAISNTADEFTTFHPENNSSKDEILKNMRLTPLFPNQTSETLQLPQQHSSDLLIHQQSNTEQQQTGLLSGLPQWFVHNVVNSATAASIYNAVDLQQQQQQQ